MQALGVAVATPDEVDWAIEDARSYGGRPTVVSKANGEYATLFRNPMGYMVKVYYRPTNSVPEFKGAPW